MDRVIDKDYFILFYFLTHVIGLPAALASAPASQLFAAAPCKQGALPAERQFILDDSSNGPLLTIRTDESDDMSDLKIGYRCLLFTLIKYPESITFLSNMGLSNL